MVMGPAPPSLADQIPLEEQELSPDRSEMTGLPGMIAKAEREASGDPFLSQRGS